MPESWAGGIMGEWKWFELLLKIEKLIQFLSIPQQLSDNGNGKSNSSRRQ